MKFHTFNPWEYMPAGGETGKVLVDPTKSKRVYISSPQSPDRFVQRSNDGGKHWKTILTTTAFGGDDYDLAYATQRSFVMDPSNHKRLLIGTTEVFETKNADATTPTWKAISHILSPDQNNVGSQYITALAIAVSDGQTIYAATSDGHLWVTTNGGAKWKQRDQGLFGSGGAVLDLRIDPANAAHAYAVSVYAGGVWELDQTGGTFHWAKVSGDLPANLSPVCLAVDWHYSIPALYVGTTCGVFHSVNNGGEWKTFGTGLPNIVVTDLKMLQAKHVLAAATFGRGAWEILIGPSTISGNVFEDRDGDGVQDESDSGMEGVTVFLDANGNDKLDRFEFRTTTGGHGHYLFNEVPPGIYAVRQVVPYGYVQTTKNLRSLTVGGSQVHGRDFGNQAVETTGARARFVHPTELHWLPGRQPGQPIGAQAEFSSLARSGKKRKATRSSGRKARRPKR